MVKESVIWVLVACGALILICLILGIWNCCRKVTPKPDPDTKSDPNTKREYQVAMSNRLFQVRFYKIRKLQNIQGVSLVDVYFESL